MKDGGSREFDRPGESTHPACWGGNQGVKPDSDYTRDYASLTVGTEFDADSGSWLDSLVGLRRPEPT